MNLDTILWLTGIVAEAVVVFLCFRKRIFASTPVFGAYIVWSLLVDVGFYFLRHAVDSDHFLYSYIGEMITDSAFQFAVLVELSWSVLKPIRSSLPKHTIYMLAGLNLLIGLIIWPVASWTLPQEIGPISHFYIHLTQTIAALRIVIFVALAGFSQMLSIGWRNRELQIATGLGIYSISRLGISLLQTHVTSEPRYHLLEMIVVASYDFSLVYWIVAFAQRAAERQEFTPQMQNFLLTVAGAARSNRIAVANSTAGGGPKSSRP